MAFDENKLNLDICDRLIDLGIMFVEDGIVYTLIGLEMGRKVQYFGRTGVIMKEIIKHMQWMMEID
jgi:hypothetical protein